MCSLINYKSFYRIIYHYNLIVACLKTTCIKNKISDNSYDFEFYKSKYKFTDQIHF